MLKSETDPGFLRWKSDSQSSIYLIFGCSSIPDLVLELTYLNSSKFGGGKLFYNYCDFCWQFPE